MTDCPGPSTLQQLLPLFSGVIGAATGATIAFLTTRWSLSRADYLARNRERNRDDRQHMRTLLISRYDRQRKAAREYARLIASDQEALIDRKHVAVHELVLSAFEQEDLAAGSKAAAVKLLQQSQPSIVDRQEANAYLTAMLELLRQTRAEVKPPSVEDWKPYYDKALTLEGKKVEQLLEELGIDFK